MTKKFCIHFSYNKTRGCQQNYFRISVRITIGKTDGMTYYYLIECSIISDPLRMYADSYHVRSLLEIVRALRPLLHIDEVGKRGEGEGQ